MDARHVAKSYFKLVTAPIRHFANPLFEAEFLGRLAASKESSTPREFLSGCSDEFLFWVMTFSHELGQGGAPIPGLPTSWHQRTWTGASGEDALRQAFEFSKVCVDALRKSGNGTPEETRILDFGSGWGRIIRFFLRDFPQENLLGRDCWPDIVEVARKDNPWCSFSAIGAFPPLPDADSSVDLVYLYSVFSHLSEECHEAWLEDFRRVLKPGGLVVATTRSREYLVKVDRNRSRSKSRGSYQSMVATESFPDMKRTLADYDNGRFCFSGTGGGGPLDPSFYGEAAIPESYASSRWKGFNLLEFRKPRGSIDQVTLIAQKL